MSSKAIKTTVELFAGIGGFRLAAAREGLQTLWANDICPKACQVYRSQFGDAEIRQGDIRELAHEIPSHDLLTAGFPCQPFSSAGQKKGFRDPRGLLFLGDCRGFKNTSSALFHFGKCEATAFNGKGCPFCDSAFCTNGTRLSH